MNLKIKLIDEIASADIQSVGGKAKSLASLAQSGIKIPFTACLNTDFYTYFIESENLKEKIGFEIGRKDFSEMRWEEIWDCSLRIRNIFIRNDLPKIMEKELVNFLEIHFKGKKVAIRSSAPAEDSSGASFAGLHESYINISGTEEIIRHIKLVWASLWSDGALLYRNELGLDIMNSTMAVIIQEVVNADISGIAFSKNPQDETSGVIEAVLGLNQGLVDGVIEPDRWIITRKTGNIENFYIATKDYYFITSDNGLLKTEVPKNYLDKAVLEKKQVKLVFNQVMQCEKHFSKPQDMEWSVYGEDIYVLQSRPITTLKTPENDNRSWYLSLTRPYTKRF